MLVLTDSVIAFSAVVLSIGFVDVVIISGGSVSGPVIVLADCVFSLSEITSSIGVVVGHQPPFGVPGVVVVVTIPVIGTETQSHPVISFVPKQYVRQKLLAKLEYIKNVNPNVLLYHTVDEVVVVV